MKIRFSKMHGLGNDFVVIDAINQPVVLNTAQVKFLANRHFGIGCDQVLLVEKAKHADVDFCYRIYNADGGEVEQCGNGARCFVLFVHQHGLTQKRDIQVETQSGLIRLRLEDNNEATVEMGVPRFHPSDLPYTAAAQALTYTLEIAGERVEFSALSMGNPHIVLVVDNVDSAPVARLGPVLEAHPVFPQRVNVGFMEIAGKRAIRLRVFERGVGETLACGTGACAAVVAGIQRGLLESPVRVSMPGGTLTITWHHTHASVRMTGSATTVFAGEINLP